jgi:peptide deformylase
MILKIYTAPHPLLKKKARPVVTITDETRRILDNMLETMYAANGIGLAATQVGIQERLIVMDVSKDKEASMPWMLINPVVTWVSDEMNSYEEGCLSVPTHYGDVERPASVTVSFLNKQGEPQEMHAQGLLATCVQHEIDHLDGILFVDHLDARKRTGILRKLLIERQKKEKEG